MAFSLYDATVTPAQALLKSLNTILLEAEKHPNSATFLSARIYEDMNPLTFQVHIATAYTERAIATLSGREPAPMEDDFTSFADMHARIDQVLKALDAVDKETVNRKGEEVVATPVRDKVLDVPAKVLATAARMPHVYFHVSMAYAILRKEGVPLSKWHYSRAFVSDYMQG